MNQPKKGKTSFTIEEANKILELINEKINSDGDRQKGLRERIRKIGFYATDYGLGNGFTSNDFVDLLGGQKMFSLALMIHGLLPNELFKQDFNTYITTSGRLSVKKKGQVFLYANNANKFSIQLLSNWINDHYENYIDPLFQNTKTNQKFRIYDWSHKSGLGNSDIEPLPCDKSSAVTLTALTKDSESTEIIITQYFNWIKNHLVATDKAFFDLEGLRSYKNFPGQTYSAHSDAAKWYKSTVVKLREIVSEISNNYNINLSVNYSERPNGQAGRGKIAFKDYLLIGCIPNDLVLSNNFIFIKLFIHKLSNETPRLGVEIDVNNKLENNPYVESVEDIKRESYFEILLDNTFSNNLSSILDSLINPVAKSVTLLKDYLNSINMENFKLNISLNHILFGPPGTGKTYQLNLMKEIFTERVVVDIEDRRQSIADNNAWWKLIGAILYIQGKMKVPELVNHPILLAKHNPDKPTKANQIIWSQLQLHTKGDSKYVNHTRRHGPLIFDKDQDSLWTVEKSIIEDELIDIKALADDIESLDGIKNTEVENTRYNFVTFHQSFSYEDFVQGIKPIMSDEESESTSDVVYEIQKGIFYRSCLAALRLAGYQSFTECYNDTSEDRKSKFAKAKPYALFIDEINRGNVSAIFGELITLIEKDKRLGEDQEIWVSLPYEKNLKFGVPPNLYVIGTMNTADRSVEALDTALRRRFSFQEMSPKPELLASDKLLWLLWEKDWNYRWDDEKWLRHEESLLNLLDGTVNNKDSYYKLEKLPWNEGLERNVFQGIVEFKGLQLDNLLATINQRIELLLDKDHMIGHSYFLSLVGAEDCKKELVSIFSDKIIPLLQEYFYGDFGKIGLILGKDFVSKKEGTNVKFAEFDLEDQSIYQEKKLYDIQTFENVDEFIRAVRGIYEETVVSDSDE